MRLRIDKSLAGGRRHFSSSFFYKRNEASTATYFPPPNRTTTKGKKKMVNAQRKKKNVTPKAIMAKAYVPQKVQAINFWPVRRYFKARPIPDMFQETERIYNELLRDAPQCVCSSKHPCGPPWNNGEVPQVSFDPYFALRPEMALRRSTNSQQTFQKLESVHGKDEYLSVLHMLLTEEFEEKMFLYERYTQFGIRASHQTTAHGTPQAMLTIPGIHNARPHVESGDKVLLRPEGLRHDQTHELHVQVVRTIRGSLNKKGEESSDDRVVITWLRSQDANYYKLLKSNGTFAVRFLPSTKDLQRSLTALQWIQNLNSQVARELLFPTQTPKVPLQYDPEEDTSDRDLNEKQSSFVNMVLARTRSPSRDKVRPPMVLTGPAGTGKTKTLLASIMKALSDTTHDYKKRILVCTPSHTAADVVTRRLSQHLSSKALFRLYSSDRPAETAPAELLPFARMSDKGRFVLPSVQDLLAFQVIVCTCSDAHILVMAGLTNSRLRMRRQCLNNFTNYLLDSPGICVSGKFEVVDETHFTHLFIDEAAQATEPENLIPLSVVVDDSVGSVKVEIALGGDPRQLSPDVYSPRAADGLQKSLLERLLRLPGLGGRTHLMGPPSKDSWTSMDELIEYSFQKKEDHDHLSVFLTTSYRGHPSFLIMPSRLFYFDKLRSVYPFIDSPQEDQWYRALQSLGGSGRITTTTLMQSWPIHFRGVDGTDQSVAVKQCWGSNSWSNTKEAGVVAKIVQTLVSEGISTQSIGVMAAFRAQVVLIRKILRRQNLGTVNVGIVEDYQAVETDVIILSLTRANPEFVENDMQRRVGLFKQEKRMNVALTRAEKLLVVVGSPKMMIADPVWRKWLNFCFTNGLWYGHKEGYEQFLN